MKANLITASKNNSTLPHIESQIILPSYPLSKLDIQMQNIFIRIIKSRNNSPERATEA
jgi:hypothetical protein